MVNSTLPVWTNLLDRSVELLELSSTENNWWNSLQIAPCKSFILVIDAVISRHDWGIWQRQSQNVSHCQFLDGHNLNSTCRMLQWSDTGVEEHWWVIISHVTKVLSIHCNKPSYVDQFRSVWTQHTVVLGRLFSYTMCYPLRTKIYDRKLLLLEVRDPWTDPRGIHKILNEETILERAHFNKL